MSEALSQQGPTIHHSREQLKSMAFSCGMSSAEWEHLLTVLGRLPSPTEIQMIGVMWSEHCSYKSSKRWLKELITKGPQVLQGPGENAGLVRIDEKRAMAFKVESHNHPSFVEPFQGAATGVGGILRDIFTMGARPIATGDYLRFGDLSSVRHQYLTDGVVSGIAHYGNCMGIPTVAGGISSNACYNGNILVNVFALGVVNRDQIFKSSTATPGHSVMIWGAKTGRDGIHGASLLASADFESKKTETKEQKVRVQVGDPFKEKCLMEATLEAMNHLREDLVAIQDMGAAGLTCSTMEISDKSQIGMRVELDKVPVREDKMEAFELLLSESQERMLAIVKKGSETKFEKILNRWGCEAATIGESDDSRRLRIFYRNELVVDLPTSELTDPPPVDLPEPEWPELLKVSGPAPADVKGEWNVLSKLLSHPSVASKEMIYQRYDSTVGTATVLGPGHEAAVLWIGENDQDFSGIAFKGVAAEDFYQLNPRYGAALSLTKAIRGVACSGSRALAYTDGVNAGNPNRSHVQAALKMMIEGFNDVARLFDTPCIGGNVSLYNQTVENGQPSDIFPTTFTVAAGVMNDVRKAVPSKFQKVGSEVWMIEVPGNKQELPVASLYARLFWSMAESQQGFPFLDLEGEKRLQEALIRGADHSLFLSTKDVGEGGLAVSLAKACFQKDIKGFEGDFSKTQSRRDLLLFGEAQGRVIVEIQPSKRSELMKLGLDLNLTVKRLGSVVAAPIFRINPLLNGSIEDLRKVWRSVFQ